MSQSQLARPVRITLVGFLLLYLVSVVLSPFMSGAWTIVVLMIVLIALGVIGYIVFQLGYWAWKGHFYTD